MKYLPKMIKFLGLKIPVELRIRRKNRDIRYAAACYLGLYTNVTLVTHQITLNGDCILNPDDRDIKTLIAHELVHAWTEENRIEESHIHGPIFARKAAEMNMRFNVPNIFIPEIEGDFN